MIFYSAKWYYSKAKFLLYRIVYVVVLVYPVYQWLGQFWVKKLSPISSVKLNITTYLPYWILIAIRVLKIANLAASRFTNFYYYFIQCFFTIIQSQFLLQEFNPNPPKMQPWILLSHTPAPPMNFNVLIIITLVLS